VKHDIFRSDTFRERTIDLYSHVLGLALKDSLGCENVFDFGSSDTESESTESTVGRSVRVTTDDGGSGKSETLLRTDNLNAPKGK
jgi:hypothetical protein